MQTKLLSALTLKCGFVESSGHLISKFRGPIHNIPHASPNFLLRKFLSSAVQISSKYKNTPKFNNLMHTMINNRNYNNDKFY